MSDSYVNEEYVIKLEARMAELEAVAEAAVQAYQLTNEWSMLAGTTMIQNVLVGPLRAAGYLNNKSVAQ